MLEKGVDPSLFASKDAAPSWTLKLGMLSVGIALGILIGNVLYRTYEVDRSVAYLSMVFLFGGISLILNFVIARKFKD